MSDDPAILASIAADQLMLGARTIAYASSASGRSHALPADWPAPPAELSWPVHQTIELAGVEQAFPSDELDTDAPTGTRIVIKGRRQDEQGQPDNIRPVIRDSVRWSSALDGTIIEFQGVVISIDGNSAFLEFGTELDCIFRDCVIRGDYGDSKDAPNHQTIGFVAMVNTTISGCSFGLRSVAYAEDVRMSVIADDGIQGTPIINGATLEDLTRYTLAHPDGAELDTASGLRWNDVHMRRIDGQGFAATSVTDAQIYNCTVDTTGDYGAYALAVHNLTDFEWVGGWFRGNCRITGTATNTRFIGVGFECNPDMITQMQDAGAVFIGCSNNGELIA
jgi:hypothetical protein